MIVLDSGAPIGLERNNRKAVALIQRAIERRTPIVIPATVLAQVWRNSPRQHAIRQLMKHEAVSIADLGSAGALAVGRLLAASGTSDVVDAHVVVLAQTLRAALVVTSDPDDLRVLDPKIRLATV